MILACRDRGMDLFSLNHNLNQNHSLSLIRHFNGIINSVFLSSEEDSISWTLSESKNFTVKSCYDILNDRGLRSVFKTSIWRSAAPLNVKFFAWLAFHDKILSRANLVKKGWTGPMHCELCNFYEESVTHLFFHCRISKAIWNFFLYNANNHLPHLSLSQTFSLKHLFKFHINMKGWNTVDLAIV